MQNRFTTLLVDSWNKLRWDIHEIVMPALIHAAILAFVVPRLVPIPHASIPIAFYMFWFIWNIITARLYVQISFGIELFFSVVYFTLLFGFGISLISVLLI